MWRILVANRHGDVSVFSTTEYREYHRDNDVVRVNTLLNEEDILGFACQKYDEYFQVWRTYMLIGLINENNFVESK